MLKKRGYEIVSHSNKNQINPINSFSSHLLKQMFAWGSSYILFASTKVDFFGLHCSTKEYNFGAIWLGFRSGKFENLETVNVSP